MTAAMIEVHNVSRHFKGAGKVLDSVTLAVQTGEVLGLIGPNGGGKSTLLMLMAGLIRPTEGEVRVDGRAASEVAIAATGTIGLITAEPGLYPALTGAENLAYFGGLFGLKPAQVVERSAPLLAEFGLSERVHQPAGAMSSGMRQKVSLVRALLGRPKVLLLDEPTANLDPVATHQLHSAVRAQADQGLAVVLCTHDLHAAEHICDRVAVLEHQLKALQALDGRRQAPATGPLYALYQAEVEADR